MSVVRTEWFRLVNEYYLRDAGFRGGVLEFFFFGLVMSVHCQKYN